MANSFDFCINQAFKAGKITKDTAKRLTEAEDVEVALNSLSKDLNRQKREAAIQSIRLADAYENAKSHPEGAFAGMVALMSKDPTGKAGYFNVDYLAEGYKKLLHAEWNQALSAFRTRRLGFSQDKEGLEKLVRAIYGETVDDAEIMKFAKDWKNVSEKARTLFNSKGGAISKNEDWLMPQNHDMQALIKLGKDKWKEKILPMLDRTKMTDDIGNVLDDDQFSKALDFVYETITTGGLNKTTDFTVPRLGSKLSRKGSAQRFLYFKDADSWINYTREFGRGDIFTTLTGWVNNKAHDIALMEVFGTNPEQTYKALFNQFEKEGAFKKVKTFGIPQAAKKSYLDSLFNVISGKTADGNLHGLAQIMQSTRNVLTASTLGAAFLSAISDVGFAAIGAKANNIPIYKQYQRMFSLMNPGNEQDRIFAAKIGIIMDSWIDKAHSSNRYSDVYGNGVTAKVAEGVMRASMLEPWTESSRTAFGMEFAAMLAENFNKSFDSLDGSLLKGFETYGIGKSDWDLFRKSKTLQHKGVNFVDYTQDGGKKFHQMVLMETDYAIPTPDAKTQAITTGGLGRATVAGQAWRSAMMLKSFPISLGLNHFVRGAYQATTGDKITYFGSLLASTTILGAVSLQAKDLAAGREPRPLDAKFLGSAFMQGGGAGIFGDFLFSDQNRFGSGVTATLFGPTGELLDKSVKLTIGNIQQAVRGEETNVLGESVQFIDRYTPSIWQVQILKNSFFDNVELMADKKAQKRFNRIVKKRKKEYGAGYLVKPGQTPWEALQ